MNERQTDFELLRDFTRKGDQAAFAVVVRRHLDLVYATALRKAEDPGAAEEISQNVFAALARKAWQFAPDDSLPAWLHRTTLLEARAWLRGELRRRRREQTAAEMGTIMKTADESPALRALVPLLDEALLSLKERDRAALLLRFQENRSFRDVGASLGVNEDAAQKRVAAAVEKLAQFFQRRGFRTATVAVATAALQRSAIPAPGAFVASMAKSAIQMAPPGFVGVTLMARLTALTSVQKFIVGVALVGAVSVAWHWQQNSLAQAAAPDAVESLVPPPNETVVVVAAASPPMITLPPEPEPVPAAAVAANPEKPYATRLAGLIDLPAFKAVLLEVTYRVTNQIATSQGPQTRIVSRTNQLYLSEDQSESVPVGAPPVNVRFEILRVNSEAGTVRVIEAGQTAVYTFDPPDLSLAGDGTRPPNVRFQGAAFQPVIRVFGRLANRTVLLHPRLVSNPVYWSTDAHTPALAAGLLKTILEQNRVVAISDGEKFEWVVPADVVSSLPAPFAPPPGTNAIAAGMINFQSMPVPQVLEIYAQFTGRTLVNSRLNARPALLPVNLVTQTSLSREEVCYALETLLSWQGLQIVPVDDQSFKVVRSDGRP